MRKLAIDQPAPDFTLPGVDGKEYTLRQFQSKKAVVLVFVSTSCPQVRAYEARLIALQREFGPREVQFLAINANDGSLDPEESFSNMVRRAQTKSYNFPYLRDQTQRVARSYGAECTPEAFVLNGDGRLRYVGRIDDNWQHPERVHSHDLRQAIEAVLAGRPVPNAVTHAMGGQITWKM
jgi:peroxiredoxin